MPCQGLLTVPFRCSKICPPPGFNEVTLDRHGLSANGDLNVCVLGILARRVGVGWGGVLVGEVEEVVRSGQLIVAAHAEPMEVTDTCTFCLTGSAS